jgi:SH3-like domain-containing protein
VHKVPQRLAISLVILTIVSALSASLPAAAEDEAAAPDSRIGFSGLPVPRFVAMKKNEVYGREGPSADHDVVTIYRRRGLPVKVIAETSDNIWRRVEDHEGRRVWINRVMLVESRHAVIGSPVVLFAEPSEEALPRARLEPGVLARIETCGDDWCRVRTDGYRGWAPRNALWGVL